jgi:peptidase M23-like protein
VSLPTRAPLRRASAQRCLGLAALVAALGTPGMAAAQAPTATGGASAAPPPAAPATGAPAPPAAPAPAQRPVIDAITCRTTCLGLARATKGSVVRVSGEGMGTVTSIVLLGRRGSRDDVTVPATPVSPTAVEATLPPRARGGPARVIAGSGARSLRSVARLEIGRARSSDAGGSVIEARAETRRLLFENGRRATVDFYVRGAAPVDVIVDVVRASDRTAVAHYVVAAASPGAVQTIDWDGTVNGAPQPEGRYVFQVAAGAGAPAAGAHAAQAEAPPPRRESFWLVHNAFPIAGPHTYGEGFGVPRGSHVHEGQDVMAECGTPLVAAHGGTVKFAGTQSLAGNYVVISTDDGSADHVYMHLSEPALVARGAVVTTGQQIGFVGRTGDATACHLHFELWPAPGWYTGGQAVDPLPALKAWDAGAA